LLFYLPQLTQQAAAACIISYRGILGMAAVIRSTKYAPAHGGGAKAVSYKVCWRTCT